MPARLRLNVFSPLPPAHTDIANYTARLLPHLGRLADVTAWTSQPDWDAVAAEGVTVRPYTPEMLDPGDVNRADASIFNFGNNRLFHADIFRVAQAVPGIAVLHDLNYQHFFAGLALEPHGAADYLARMRRHHGAAAEAQGRRFLSGTLPIEALVTEYPLTGALADTATALVVHNAAGVAGLRDQCRLACQALPLPYPAGPVPPPRDNRGPPFRLVVFGFIGPNRRLPSVLEALARPDLAGQFRLDIYGQLDEPGEVDGLIVQLGLAAHVTRHGFVAEPVLEAALAGADLALNLRTPTMGEASGSQLRIWSHALPALVSRTGWYAGLPDDAVFFVDPAREVAEIGDTLLRLTREPEVFRRAGQRGREILIERHDPAAVAEALVQLVRAAPSHHRRRAAIDLARLSAGHLLDMFPADGLPRVAPGVAAGIAALFGAASAR